MKRTRSGFFTAVIEYTIPALVGEGAVVGVATLSAAGRFDATRPSINRPLKNRPFPGVLIVNVPRLARQDNRLDRDVARSPISTNSPAIRLTCGRDTPITLAG